MNTRKNISALAILLFIGLGFIFYYKSSWHFRELADEFYFDFTHKNPYVADKSTIDEILGTFPIKKYSDLGDDYLNHSQANQKSYQRIYKNKIFYIIRKKDALRKIVGNTRIKDLVCKNHEFHKLSYSSLEEIIWLIDKELLYKILELQDKLEEEGYNRDGFTVISAFRDPKHNKAVGGKSRSRHLYGDAADLNIGDINKDGLINKKDKDLILKICDSDIIANKGGLGRYPNKSTIHIDVRGHRARW